MAGGRSSRGHPGQKLIDPAAPLTADMDVDYHPDSQSKHPSQQTSSHWNTPFEEGGDEDGDFEIDDDFEGDDEEMPAELTKYLEGLKAASQKRLENEKNEKDLNGSTDPMASHGHISPVMDDDSDSDSDPFTSSNSLSGYDSEESVDAYELKGKDYEEKLPSPAPRRAKKTGPKPGAAATRKRASTSAPTSSGNTTTPSSSATTSNRARAFAKGGRAVDTTLDAVDTIIFDMKASGHGDKAISTRLREEGLAKYDPKTISTRYRRIREAKMAETDADLRTRRKRWSAEEDAALMDAYLHALRRQDEEMAKLRKRLFKDVAFRVAAMLPEVFYSAEACEGRYGELSSGNAVTERDLEEPEVERAEGKKRLTAVWELDMERVMREGKEWEDGIVKELAEGERERRAEKRAKRGGTVKELLAKRGPVKRGRPKGSKSKAAKADSE